MRDAILGEHRDTIRRAAARRGAERIALFGSTARGEDTADSDCDFMADFGGRTTVAALTGLRSDLEGLLGRPVDVVSMGALRVKHRHMAAGAVVL